MDHAYQLLEAVMFGPRAGESPLTAMEDLVAAAYVQAQARHDAQLLAEARAIAAGELTLQPTPEHLRLLLAQLERVSARLNQTP